MCVHIISPEPLMNLLKTQVTSPLGTKWTVFKNKNPRNSMYFLLMRQKITPRLSQLEQSL